MKNIKLLILGLLLYSSATAQYEYDAPWNQPIDTGLNFTVHGIDNVPDIYGDIIDPQLVVFFAGNQFMCLDSLFASFKKAYPQYQRIFAETLPPGILYQQIEKGCITIGNMRIDIQPDVYTAGKRRIDMAMPWMSDTATYAYNHLAIMVYKGNPKKIKSLNDLGKKDMRLVMPNPKWEGIGQQISNSLEKAGGQQLLTRVMQSKVDNGNTYLTKIHHRESPLSIMRKKSDAGVVWTTEALYQKKIGHPVELINIPDNLNTRATYMAGILKKAKHKQAAKDFFQFIQSPEGQRIYAMYGFQTLK